MVKALKYSLTNRYVIFVFAEIILNTVVYSWISIERYEAFNSGVFDLGVNSSLLYGVLHGELSVSKFLSGDLALNKSIYIVIGFFYGLFPNQEFLLVFQSFWLSVGAFVLYLITKRILNDELSSLLIGTSYLLYYPLLSVYWFDFHFMAIFPTFFLLSFYFYISNRHRYSIIFAFLAMTTDLLAPIIIGFFGIYTLIIDKYQIGKNIFHNTFALTIVSISVTTFLLTNLYFGFGYSIQYSHYSATLGATIVQNTAFNKLSYIFSMTLPTLFISFLAPETMLFSVPYFALAFKNNYLPFLSTMFYQYPSLVAPAIFISLIYGLKRIGNYRLLKKNMKVNRKLAITLVSVNIILALLFSPAGNLVTSNYENPGLQHMITGSSGSYNTAQNIHITNYDKALKKIFLFIPKGSSVLIQNNMPQLTQNFHWQLPFFLSPTDLPQYVIADPYSPTFTHYSLYGSGNYTMYGAINHLLSTSEYGLLAEYDGIVLLNHNYSGKPLIYKPLNQIFDSSNLKFSSSAFVSSGKAVITNLTDGSVGWYGPYSFLTPGNFSVKLNVSTNNDSISNNFQFQIDYTDPSSYNQTLLLKSNITGNSLMENKYETLYFNLSLHRYYENVEYRSFYFNWNGDFTFYNITITQTSQWL